MYLSATTISILFHADKDIKQQLNTKIAFILYDYRAMDFYTTTIFVSLICNIIKIVNWMIISRNTKTFKRKQCMLKSQTTVLRHYPVSDGQSLKIFHSFRDSLSKKTNDYPSSWLSTNLNIKINLKIYIYALFKKRQLTVQPLIQYLSCFIRDMKNIFILLQISSTLWISLL